MADHDDIDHLNPPTGQMADNVIGFARALRAAGIPVGPGAVIDALNALQVIEIGNRADVFTTLESIFVKRHEHALIFAQAFDLFFRARRRTGSTCWIRCRCPTDAKKKPPPASRRVQEALAQPAMRDEAPQVAGAGTCGCRSPTSEILQQKDFAQMSAAEIAEVTRAIAKMKLPQAELRTRRYQPDAQRPAARHAAHLARQPAHRRRDHRNSQARPDRQAGADRGAARYFRLDERIYPAVPAFPPCHHRRPQARLGVPVRHAADQCDAGAAGAGSGRGAGERVRQSVEDWAGGTRIATSLHTFNKLWGRRVLGQGAIVLLISDGLEREADAKLAFEMDRLHRSCRRLIWLNPLLRFGGFEAKAQGIKMMLPHVDEFRPVHNLTSMEGLIAALSSAPPPHPSSRIRSAA